MTRAPAYDAAAIADELPSWCGGVMYRADVDTLALMTFDGEPGAVELEMTPAEARALVEALSACLTRAAQAARILDVGAD